MAKVVDVAPFGNEGGNAAERSRHFMGSLWAVFVQKDTDFVYDYEF